MTDFVRAGENIERHASGIYYLRAKVAGKVVRRSLDTRNLAVAKLARNALLDRLRKESGTIEPRTLADAVETLQTHLLARPHIRPKTADACRDLCRILSDSLPANAMAHTWSAKEAAAWWLGIGRNYAPSYANKILGAVKRMFALLIDARICLADPTHDMKRMRQRKKALRVPSRDELQAIIDRIAGSGKRGAIQSGCMVGFLAFAGLRVGELRALKWSDIGEASITVGADGMTKGGSFRVVPISEPLRAILARLHEVTGYGEHCITAKSPRRALSSACRSLGLPHLRIHDLRHWFATWAIQSGVDIPTVAKWLGHKDGGALAMKTYGHIRDDHSLEQVARLR